MEEKQREQAGSLLGDRMLYYMLLAALASIGMVSIAYCSMDERVYLCTLFAITAFLTAAAMDGKGRRFRIPAVLVGLAAMVLLILSSEEGQAVSWQILVWVILPLASVLIAERAWMAQKAENSQMDPVLESTILLDAVTGLYNERALGIDLDRAMALGRRNGLDVTLMILEAEDNEELMRRLKGDSYASFLRGMRIYLEYHLRVEDRIYIVNDQGRFAVILMTDLDGALMAKRRLEKDIRGCAELKKFPDICETIALKGTCLSYDPETIGSPLDFKDQAIRRFELVHNEDPGGDY